MDLELLKYPTGKWKKPDQYHQELIRGWIEEIRILPAQMDGLLKDLPEEKWVYCYRPDGWTLRQLVHHIADSHMNAYIRHKLAFTENQARISPYLENAWADLEDVKKLPPSVSCDLLRALHQRWAAFLDSLDADGQDACFFHPQHDRLIPIKESISMYAWHGRHHLAHIRNALQRPY